MSQICLSQDKYIEKEFLTSFENLVMRSFFQYFGKDFFGNITCKMYDMLQNFSQCLTKHEYYIIEVHGVQQKKHLDEKVCHLYVEYKL